MAQFNFNSMRTNHTASELLQTDILRAERSILYTLICGFLLGVTGIVGFSLQLGVLGKTLLFILLLMGCASFISGFFVGILFGIPKRSNNATDDNALNNGLVEIADWLTKIIVGLGLINLKQIPGYLMSIAKYVQKEANAEGTALSVLTVCLIIYFSITGLYIGYNYMRLGLPGRYKRPDNMVEKLQRAQEELVFVRRKVIEVAQANEMLSEKIKAYREETKNQPATAPVNVPAPAPIYEPKIEPASEPVVEHENWSGNEVKNEIKQAPLVSTVPENSIKEKVPVAAISDDAYIGTMKEQAEETFKKGLAINQAINDPQKGMWGGKNEDNKRILDATVIHKSLGLYRIMLTVKSADPVNAPLQDDDVVLFALHDTCKPPYRLVHVQNGTAHLELYSFKIFTVGAFVDKGKTQLEIDLANLPGASND